MSAVVGRKGPLRVVGALGQIARALQLIMP